MADLPITRTVNDLRATVADWRAEGHRVALVPTMGALHHGHMTLIDHAKKYADKVVVSVFVNPTQFGPNEDFDAYPRTETEDCAMVAAQGGNMVYAPTVNEMYPNGFATKVTVGGVSDVLCGAARPGHFDGVALIVTKLLLQCGPDVAVFGEKDFQQLQVIRRFVRDLDIPVEILGAPLIRDADGLATSSRNKYLTDDDRAQGLHLHRTLQTMAEAIAKGATAADATAQGRSKLEDAGITQIDYLEIRDMETMALVEGKVAAPARAYVAAKIGKARLIDNWPVG
ncbi:MAG: pantoate--beta-alanine ligase [Alphaproteobacteria bacterium]